MKFYNQTYEDLFSEIFSDLAKEYNLKIAKKMEDTMYLFSKRFILSIGIFVAGTSIQYIDLKKRKVYELSDYIVTKTTEKDREGFSPKTIIADIVDTSLRIRKKSLENNFSDLLSGNSNWFNEYKKSEYFWELAFRKELLL